jgi:hypothetical protein
MLDGGCVENPLDPASLQSEPKIFLKKVPGDALASVWRLTPRGRALLDYYKGHKKGANCCKQSAP